MVKMTSSRSTHHNGGTMNAQQNGSDIIAQQIRAMRSALEAAKKAVHEWRRQSGSRDGQAFGMFVLLGMTVSDNDGEETLDVVASFFEEHGERLAKLGDRTSLEDLGAFWFLLLRTVMRPGEAKAFEWKQVDSENGRPEADGRHAPSRHCARVQLTDSGPVYSVCNRCKGASFAVPLETRRRRPGTFSN